MKHLIIFVILSLSSFAYSQIIMTGNLSSRINTFINNMPDEDGNEYHLPTTGNLTTWTNIINDILAGNYSSAHTRADSIGYQLLSYTDNSVTPNKFYYVLEKKSTGSNYWGTFIYNPAPSRPKLFIQSPHPKYDSNTGQQGFYIFQTVNAGAWYISGVHRCNSTVSSSCDGTTDACNAGTSYRISDQPHNIDGVLQRTTSIFNAAISGLIVLQNHGFGKTTGDPDVIMGNGTSSYPSGTDYLLAVANNLTRLDTSLTFKIAHINTDWTRLTGTTNVQGRLLNGIANACTQYASSATGRFLHIEQSYAGLRDSKTNWGKLANAIAMSIPINTINSGNWSDTSIWPASILPDSLDGVFITSGQTITVNANNAQCFSVTFGSTTSKIAFASGSELNVYGDFTLYSVSHNAFSTWASGAKINFTGGYNQILGGWSTSGSSTSFMEMTVDKWTGKVSTAGNNMRFSWGTSLEIIDGTFELSSTDDIETRDISGTATTATMTIFPGAVFNMAGSTSYYRKGTFTDQETGKTGIMTVYGSAYLACGTTTRINLLGINIENGGFVEVPTSRSTVSGSFNVGTVAIKNGGTFQSDITTAYWYSNSVTPTLVDIQNGGEFNITSSTFSMPQSINNNGSVRYSKTDVQNLQSAITTYNNLILSGSGTKTLTSTITVNGTLSLRGTANLGLGSYTLNYGPSAVLQYGSSGQTSADTTTDAEWPASAGPSNVSIYNSGGVTLHANRMISGTLGLTLGVFDNNGFANNRILTLSNGATIKRSSGSLSAAPSFAGSINLEYNSTLVSDTSSYEMPSSTTALYNLVISSTQGVTLGSNVTVNGTLYLTGSNLTTTSSKLITLNSSASISGGSSTSFVNGPLAWTVASANPVTNVFPVGKGTSYRPLQLTVTQSASTPTLYTAEQFNTAPASRTLPGTLNSISSVRYFNISKGAGSGVISATVQLNYGTDDLVSDASVLRIAKDDGAGAWVDLGGSGTAPTTGTITSTTNFSTFSDFVLARGNNASILTLTALIEGLYNGTAMVPDTITVELHNINSPYGLVESKKGVLNSAGLALFAFTTAVNGTPYYLAVKHRNAIETWSSVGQTFTSSALNYDFTSDQGQSYGSNMIQKGTKWCIYSGDVNQDGIVDSGDLGLVDNDNANYVSGYTDTDVNGDGIVDSGDLGIIDNNNAAYVGKIIPASVSAIKKVKIKNLFEDYSY
jgi:hypothetical protein